MVLTQEQDIQIRGRRGQDVQRQTWRNKEIDAVHADIKVPLVFPTIKCISLTQFSRGSIYTLTVDKKAYDTTKRVRSITEDRGKFLAEIYS